MCDDKSVQCDLPYMVISRCSVTRLFNVMVNWHVVLFYLMVNWYKVLFYLILSYLSHSLADRWGTTGDVTTSFLHSSSELLREGKSGQCVGLCDGKLAQCVVLLDSKSV